VQIPYYLLAEIINNQRPYGKDGEVFLPDLGDDDLFAVKAVPDPEPRGDDANSLQARRRDTIDVFGELATARAPHRVGVTVTAPNLVEVSTTGAVDPQGAGRVILPGGKEMAYMKGVRIPYKYKADDGVTDVYANIMVLYIGTGHI
jgi:hypothetical protein